MMQSCSKGDNTMVSNFCSSCGAAKVSPNAQFCHICGASLDLGGQADRVQAMPSGSPTLYGALQYAHRPAISSSHATRATIGIIFATIGVSIVVGIVEYFGSRSLYLSFSGGDTTSIDFAITALVVVMSFMALGGFEYSILRLAQKSFVQTWLEAMSIGSVAFCLLYVIGASTIFPVFSVTYQPEKSFLAFILITSGSFSALGVLIGVGLASRFAYWQLFRPQAIGLSLEQIIGLAFGPLVLIFVVFLLFIAFEGQNDVAIWLFLPIPGGVALFAMPFIVQRIALDRLRRVRPDLFR
jgi:hypothetical protein